MRQIDLEGRWTLERADDGLRMETEVPGDVNAALRAARLVPDPFLDTQAEDSYWISSRTWIYSRKFDFSGDFECARLVFEGADGVCDVYLNGCPAGRLENFFRRHRLDVSKLLRQGENVLEVRFLPIDGLLGPREGGLIGWRTKRAFLRKPQYNFGWDWAVPLPGIGLGSVKLELDFGMEITDLSVRAHTCGRVDFTAEISSGASEAGCFVRITAAGHGERHEDRLVFDGRRRAFKPLYLDKPRLWWPNGYGEHPLYDYSFELCLGGEVIQTVSGRFGVREVSLLEEPFTPEAGNGYSFWLIVNGERIFCKGGNWVPTRLWPGMIRDVDYDYYLKMAADADFDMMRVWGGGLYEHGRFYDLCDELGIMVWQDFMFASAGYPADLLRDEIIREADYQIRRLRCHPCVCVWCGCNEDYRSWSYRPNVFSEFSEEPGADERPGAQRDGGDYSLAGPAPDRDSQDPQLYTMLLRGLTGRLGLGTPYVESSPMSMGDYGNMPESGNSHVSCWKYALMETGGEYRNWRRHFDKVCSFNSEFCIQGPCSERLLKSIFSEEHRWPPDESWTGHIQRGHLDLPHHEQTLMIAGANFGKIDSLQKYVKYGQAMHAEMMRAEFDSARCDFPNNGGTMVWMFNDSWPTASWSVIDYEGHPKPCYYAARRACSPVSPILFEREGTLRAAVSNHTLENVEFEYEWGEAGFDGKVLSCSRGRGKAGKCSTAEIGRTPLARTAPGTDYYFLRVRAGGRRFPAVIYYPDGFYGLKFPEPVYNVEYGPAVRDGDGYTVSIKVKAATFVRFFHIEHMDAAPMRISDNYFDMEKGGERVLLAEFDSEPDTGRLAAGDWTSEWM